jgi:O-antigen/teichoic acid export membrane protein
VAEPIADERNAGERNAGERNAGERRPTAPPAPSVMRMSAWAVAAQMSIMFLGAGTSIIQNRTLGPDGRGVVGLVQLWPLMLAGFAGAGWISALGSCICRSPETRRAYWSAALLTELAISAATCALGWVALPWLMNDSPELWDLARWSLAVIPLALIGQAAGAGLEALHRFDLSGRVRVCNPIVQLALLVVLAASRTLTPWTYCASYVVMAATSAAYGSWLFARVSSGSWQPIWGPLPGFVLRAAPLTWTQVLQLRADQYVIALFAVADPTAFGAYVVGTTLAAMSAPVAQGLALVLLPASASRSEADAVELFARMVRYFVLAATLLAAPIALAAPQVLMFFYGSQFESGAYALRIGLVVAILSGAFSMGLNTIQGAGRPGTAAILGMLCGLVSVGGSVLLLPHFGYLGAALGQAIGLTVGLALLCACYRDRGLTLLSLVPRAGDVIWLWNFSRDRLMRLRSAVSEPESAPPSNPPLAPLAPLAPPLASGEVKSATSNQQPVLPRGDR